MYQALGLSEEPGNRQRTMRTWAPFHCPIIRFERRASAGIVDPGMTSLIESRGFGSKVHPRSADS